MADQVAVWPGSGYPLGATYDGVGTNFALFSGVAERVELCLFGADGTEDRVTLREMDGFVWHGYLPGIGPGQLKRAYPALADGKLYVRNEHTLACFNLK